MYKKYKPHYNEIVFDEQQLSEIKDLYLSGDSSVNIGKKYGVSHKVILKALHNMGVDVNRKNSIRKYKLNESFFDCIDNEIKAYILGLLWADGHNEINKGTIVISLQEEDKDILDKINYALNYDRKLEFIDYSNKNDYGYHYKNQYRLSIFSNHMSNILANLGMISNKSLCLTFPDIPKVYYRDFIRGYFDGDGSLYQNIINQNNKHVEVTITSTENFCLKIKQICFEELGLNAHIYDASCHNGITKVFCIGGRNVCKLFLDWIYENATIYMNRKYKRYCEYYN